MSAVGPDRREPSQIITAQGSRRIRGFRCACVCVKESSDMLTPLLCDIIVSLTSSLPGVRGPQGNFPSLPGRLFVMADGGQRWFGSSRRPPFNLSLSLPGGQETLHLPWKKQTNTLSSCNKGSIFSSVKQLSDGIEEENVLPCERCGFKKY